MEKDISGKSPTHPHKASPDAAMTAANQPGNQTEVQWLTTAPNPRHPGTGHDAGQRGWRRHAVEAVDGATFRQLGVAKSLCGIYPSHGWGLDLFIEAYCENCEFQIEKREALAKGEEPPKRPKVERCQECNGRDGGHRPDCSILNASLNRLGLAAPVAGKNEGQQ